MSACRVRRALVRFASLVAGGLAAVLLLAGPAGADPARPTNYRSEVTYLEPATDAVRVEVVGGDAFLRIVVEPGHEATILGYSGEPYVRILADGTVEQNDRSPAVLLNTDRYARVGSQTDLSEDEIRAMEPQWSRVGGDGTFVWHDHNSHWMSTALPPQLGGAQSGVVFDDWVVQLEVDGVATEVHGTLVRDAPPSVVPWVALAAVFAVAVALLALRSDPLLAIGAVLALVAIAAFAVSAAGQFGLPEQAGRQYHLVIVPVIAALAATIGLVLRRTPSGLALIAGATLTLPIWIFGMFGVLTHAHAPTDVSVGVQRTVIALAIGAVTAAVAVVAIRELRSQRPRPRPASPTSQSSASGPLPSR